MEFNQFEIKIRCKTLNRLISKIIKRAYKGMLGEFKPRISEELIFIIHLKKYNFNECFSIY